MSEQKPLDRLAVVEARLDATDKEINRIHRHINSQDETRFRQPRLWTERVNLDATVKEGFRVKEVTVTVQYQEGDRPTEEERQARISAAIDAGQAIADSKNHQRNQVNRFS